ncbi:MAG: pyrroline-5-carboxylate reductase [Saprospiraceae bacterium]|nr:pyrroline-5-carboxylate reductase [Saprospiraceae bacterium]
MKNTIAIIGCGNLGKAILHGLVEDEHISATNLYATKRHPEDIESFRSSGVKISNDNHEAVKSSEILVFGLKPYTILNVLEELKDNLDPSRHIVVSLATGISIRQIKDVIGMEIPVVRAMPNTASDVMESLTCLCTESENPEILAKVQYVFDCIGTTIVIDENLMESATVLGACGIAYVLRFIRAMIQGGIQIGFDSVTASKIVTQTVKGASELLIQRKNHPEFEIDKVTTPRGCTIVGINEMEHNGFSSALIKGLIASFEEIEK